MGKDYYNILGVAKDADESALKKGTRKYLLHLWFAKQYGALILTSYIVPCSL